MSVLNRTVQLFQGNHGDQNDETKLCLYPNIDSLMDRPYVALELGHKYQQFFYGRVSLTWNVNTHEIHESCDCCMLIASGNAVQGLIRQFESVITFILALSPAAQ